MGVTWRDASVVTQTHERLKIEWKGLKLLLTPNMAACRWKQNTILHIAYYFLANLSRRRHCIFTVTMSKKKQMKTLAFKGTYLFGIVIYAVEFGPLVSSLQPLVFECLQEARLTPSLCTSLHTTLRKGRGIRRFLP